MTCCVFRCLLEVQERIGSLKALTEIESRDHEDHELFKYEHDEQLLLWKQRYIYHQLHMHARIQ